MSIRALLKLMYTVEGIFETPMQHTCSPIARAVICQWFGNQLTCWADTQVTMRVQKDLSKCLGVPLSSIRVITDYPVGGYGGKSPGNIGILVAIMAKRTGRPVKAMFSRAEDFLMCAPSTQL